MDQIFEPPELKIPEKLNPKINNILDMILIVFYLQNDIQMKLNIYENISIILDWFWKGFWMVLYRVFLDFWLIVAVKFDLNFTKIQDPKHY